jgi:hypothetical protein
MGFLWYLRAQGQINGNIESRIPVNFYILDEANLQRFERGPSFSYYIKPSRIGVYSSAFEWRALEGELTTW